MVTKKDREARQPRKSVRSYGTLKIDDIVDAALIVIERGGVPGLSMRSLAEELQLSSMAVYHYVSDKDHLLDLVIERVLSQFLIPRSDLGFSHNFTVAFYNARNVWRKYPGLPPLVLARGKGQRSAELAAALKAEGLSDRQAEAAEFAIGCYFYGLMCLERMHSETEDEFERHVADSLTVLLAGIDALRGATGDAMH